MFKVNIFKVRSHALTCIPPPVLLCHLQMLKLSIYLKLRLVNEPTSYNQGYNPVAWCPYKLGKRKQICFCSCVHIPDMLWKDIKKVAVYNFSKWPSADTDPVVPWSWIVYFPELWMNKFWWYHSSSSYRSAILAYS